MVIKYHNKLAFTMIELIFAIVIIGIAVLGLPLMTNITNRGLDSNIDQEAIYAASAEIIAASAGVWDSNSMQDSAITHTARVVDIGGLCTNTPGALTHRLKIGHIPQPFHRRCVNAVNGVAANSNDPAWPSLNSAVHVSQNMMSNAVTNAYGYKKGYNSTLVVGIAGNIKTITVNVFRPDATLVTSLSMQSANIGSVEPWKVRF